LDAKKLLKELTPEDRETISLNLNVRKDIGLRAKKAFPRNKQPSLSKVVERLLEDFLDKTERKRP